MKTRDIAVTALAVAALATSAHAEFKLDDRYTDADNDLVADIPEAASDQVDPNTLVFAYMSGPA